LTGTLFDQRADPPECDDPSRRKKHSKILHRALQIFPFVACLAVQVAGEILNLEGKYDFMIA